MQWLEHTLTVSNLINVLVVVGVFMIKNELHHIRESIDDAKKLAGKAEATALKAHERIDHLLEMRRVLKS